MLARFNHPQHDPDAVLQRIQQWIEHSCADLAPEVYKGVSDTSPTLFCRLHPAAEDVEISFLDASHITAMANTAIGPGFHISLCKMLKKLESPFDLQWMDTSNENNSDYLDEAGYFFSGDASLVEKEMLDWLQGVCKMFFDGTFEGASAIMISMSIGETFTADPGFVTALGPRNLEWARRTTENPTSGRDFFSWWKPDLDAEYFRNRALVRMWREVRWRIPATDGERNVMKYCVDSLETAYKLDENLQYPWTEWAEMLAYLGAGDESTGYIRERATTPPAIGYRRGNVGIDLPGDWQIQLPGSFGELQYDEGTTSAFDPPREFWFTAYAFADNSQEEFERKRTELIAELPNCSTKQRITGSERESEEPLILLGILIFWHSG